MGGARLPREVPAARAAAAGLVASNVGVQLQAAFILSVETEELGISAGLQDRVAQVGVDGG